MKILHIRFANLNSLAGSWAIDLTSPEYGEDGIFAITGPTGAGKSTVLDAICLALYGRTPRLKVISKKTNEIMTRQIGECWSEVEFSTAKGTYRCHWSQHRSRRKATGDLQPPRHEIIDCRTNKPIETKIRLVADKVVEVTGMNYDQFTRSIMLAQGDFNAFLQAPADERAPILEQITGTEIYSRISQKVHERRATEQHKLDVLRQECDGFIPLSEEQQAEIVHELATLTKVAEASQITLRTNRKQIEWHINLQKLESDINHLSKKLELNLALWEKNTPQLLRLERSEKAAEIDPLYDQLAELQALQKQQKTQQVALSGQIDQLTRSADKTSKQEKGKREELEQLRQEAKKQETVIKEVRRLDLELQSLFSRRQEIERNLRQESEKQLNDEKEIQLLSEKLLGLEKRTKQLGKYLNEHSRDKQLVDEFRGIEEQSSQLLETAKQHSQLQATLAATQTRFSALTQQYDEADRARNVLKSDHQRTEERCTAFSDRITELLGNITIEQFNEQERDLVQISHTLEQQASLLSQAKKKAREHELHTNKVQSLARQKKAKSAEVEEILSRIASQEQQVEKQGKIAHLAARITSYEEERHRLHDGTPCPLCGALEHPYSTSDQIPEEQYELKLLKEEQKQLAKLQRELSNTHSQLSAIDKETELTATLIAQGTAAQNELVQSLHLLDESFSLDLNLPQIDTSIEAINNRLTKITRQRQKFSAQRKAMEEQQKLLEDCRKALDNYEKKLIEKDQELNLLDRERIRVQALFEQSTKEFESISQTLKRIEERLRQKLTHFTDQDITAATCKEVIERLLERREHWLHNETNMLECIQQRDATLATLESRQLLQKSHSGQIEKLKEQDGKLRSGYDDLMRKRRHLFGDKNPDTLEQQIHSQLEASEVSLSSLTSSLGQQREQTASLLAQKETLAQLTIERHEQIELRQKQFMHRLEASNFSDINSFLKARVEPEERNELRRQVDEQQQAIKDLKLLVATKKKSLEEEKAQSLTEKTLSELEQETEVLQNEYSELQQKIGALRQQQSDDQKRRQQHADSMVKLSDQQKELARWSRLHELIGSSDGKKFRNFAQGLTFEIMVHHANTNLSMMSDRYLLVRDQHHPLDLQVVDNYQGGEIRSTKNLSGGESFIISLALALGLSAMASHNVQVDSLFLDEGFGTLDEDSLQIALDTLSSLHQEGKLIGIISHVAGLRERISTQIKVIPGIGGVSQLSGPGISKFQHVSGQTA